MLLKYDNCILGGRCRVRYPCALTTPTYVGACIKECSAILYLVLDNIFCILHWARLSSVSARYYRHDMLNSEQNYGLNKEVPSVELLNIQAKKASRRGKMSHVTKLLNNIYNLIETSGSIRELDRVINSLNEAFSGFVKRHDEYIAVLTSEVDEIEIDLATDKLVEIEEKIANCKLKAEQYISAQQKESESQRRGSQEKCLLSVSACSRVPSRKKSTYTHLSKEQEYRSRKRLDEIKERHHYEEKLQDLKLKTLKREMQIRRELEIRQAERDLESCSIAKSSSSSSKNSSNPQSVADQSLKKKQLARQS